MSMRPSHRNPNDLQPEVCHLCGNYVGHVHLLESDVENLRGYAICDMHRMERQHRIRPSYNDIRRGAPPLPVPEVARLQPIGGSLWGNETEEELEELE